jgi:hypothetical protein
VNILLYNPDNGVTRNFMPHLWMFLLQSLTPPGHKVHLIDGNARPMKEEELASFVREHDIRLVGIGAMTRMAARAYQMADAARAAGALVVMGGPHVTEVPDEPLGRNGSPRHVDAIALGEADATWPQIVNDAAAGILKEVYSPLSEGGVEVKPTLQDYPQIDWDNIDLSQFNLFAKMPGWARFVVRKVGLQWKSLYMVPIESGRGCPYGCDFCTVTGFFGDSIRFRTNESVVTELLAIKKRAARDQGAVGVFFIDDNFAINVKRTKSLLREIIARDATVPWVAQISINLLRDKELLDLIAASGGRWIFIGLESIDAGNLADVNKGFNKPAEYAGILQGMADRGLYAITSFIFGMDGDQPGRCEPNGRSDPVLASRPSRVWIADALPCHASLRPSDDRETAHTPSALARLPSVPHGLHTEEHQHRSGRGRSTQGMGATPTAQKLLRPRWQKLETGRSGKRPCFSSRVFCFAESTFHRCTGVSGFGCCCHTVAQSTNCFVRQCRNIAGTKPDPNRPVLRSDLENMRARL